jgi:hypothetical protein
MREPLGHCIKALPPLPIRDDRARLSAAGSSENALVDVSS